jgi:hypothetical protein
MVMSSLTLTVAALYDFSACEIDLRISELNRQRPGVSYSTEVPLEVWWSLPSTKTYERWWSLRAAKPTDKAYKLALEALLLSCERALVGGEKSEIIEKDLLMAKMV